MVATVLRLRYRVLANNLLRSPLQLIGFCFGVLWGLSILAFVVLALVGVAATQALAGAQSAAVLGGAALLIGWIVGPLLVAGIDTTVDAGKLAPFPLTTRQVMTILVATGLTGIPGIATSLAACATLILWVRWPLAAIVALPCAALGVLTCVLATRLSAILAGGIGSRRRGRELIGTIALILLILAGPILTAVFSTVSLADDLIARVTQSAAFLAWTPLGAAWAVPSEVAAGQFGAAALKLLIALGTAAALWFAWAAALDRAAVAPPQRAARAAKPGALGLFGLLPTGGTGATWARSLTFWLRDPRYLRQLIVVPLFPLLLAFAGGVDGALFIASPLFVAFVLCVGGYTDVSYDGTAFASVLASGIRGRDDRAGRLLGAASVGVPLTVLTAVAAAVLGGRPGLLPASLAGGLGLLLVGYGVTAVSSALIATPVAAPGDSPFTSVPGQTFLSGILVFVVIAACGVLGAPALVLSLTSLAGGDPVAGWVALIVALAVGIAVAVSGVVVGGRTLERTGPDLLLRIKAFPVR